MQATCPCTCLATQLPSHPSERPSTATGELPWAPRLSMSLQFARTSNGGPRMRSGSSMAVGSEIHCLSVSHHESFPQHQRLYLVAKYIKQNRIRSYRLNQTKSDYNSRERFQNWPNYHCAEQQRHYTLQNNMFSEFLKCIWEQPGLQALSNPEQ